MSRREREKQAKRDAILDAGEQLGQSGGYDSMRMDEVAKNAEVSKGCLYLYFQNKDALCAAIATRHLGEFQKAHASESRGLEKLRAMLTAHVELFAERPQMVRFMVTWLAAGKVNDDSPSFATYREHIATAFNQIVTAIREGQEDGSIREELVPVDAAFHVWSTTVGVALFNAAGEGVEQRLPGAMNLEALRALHVEQVLRGLKTEIRQ